MWIQRELSKINVSETDFTKVAQSYELDCIYNDRLKVSGQILNPPHDRILNGHNSPQPKVFTRSRNRAEFSEW